MLDLVAEFEAMMANVIAPPLSLDEFRLFVACDSKARNALAFCEWYQRYRTVYFDRVSSPSTRVTTASSRPEIPREFARADSGSTASLCVPNIRTHGQRTQTFDRLYALKSHSFSALSESIVDSAFNTASTGGSGDGLSTNRHPVVVPEPRQSTYLPLFTVSSNGNIARRRTMPLAASDLGLVYELREQEDNRQRIQSLLVVECWARFMADMALEHINLPQTELLYIKERLPLNITHIPRPLLCRGDMLTSVALTGDFDYSRPGELCIEHPLFQAAQPLAGTESRRLATHRSLQLRPYEQLKRNLASQMRQQKAVLARTQSPLSLCFGTADVDTANYLDRAEESLNCKPALKLRRISTMPALMLGGDKNRATTRVPTTPHVAKQLPPRPSHARRLISLGELQMYHNTLKPHPPFEAAISGRTGAMQVCGYQPVPQSIRKLIVPSSIPPALFDTAAKLSSDYLLQNHFADFQHQAHFNLTRREQKVAVALSAVLFLVGAGAVAALVFFKASLAWRTFAVLPLFLSAVYISAAWTRVSISMWWRRKRPTSLIRPTHMDHIGDCEVPDHIDHSCDIKLRPIRMITGTFVPLISAGFIGAIHSTGGGSRSYGHARSQTRAENGFMPNMPAPIGTISVISLWSQYTIPAVVGDVFDSLVRFMLRKRTVGEHWFVDLDSKLYEVAEPIVLHGQCYIVGHQLAIMVVVWAALATILFIVP